MRLSRRGEITKGVFNMAEEKRPVKITETVLRDGHQSLIATRMTTEEMLPIIDKMDKVGYYSVEMWGGATFDSCLRFLDEDPWCVSWTKTRGTA